MFIIAGLGNPGEEYASTRHNVGRMVLETLRKKADLDAWEEKDKYAALVSEGKIGKEKILLLEPETFMNRSGKSLVPLVTSEKKAEQLIVVHDELDLPLGTMRIVFDRGPGGHRGVESIVRALKTERFVRVRIGISPTTPSGKLKKPKGEKAVGDFILGAFKPSEEIVLKKILKKAAEAIEMIVTEGRGKAMGEFN